MAWACCCRCCHQSPLTVVCNFFFSSTTTSTFIKSVVVSYLKWLNLSINNEKLMNLGDLGLLLFPAWISMARIEWSCLVLVLLWSLHSHLALWLLWFLFFCLVCCGLHFRPEFQWPRLFLSGVSSVVVPIFSLGLLWFLHYRCPWFVSHSVHWNFYIIGVFGLILAWCVVVSTFSLGLWRAAHCKSW